jgi:hypothetical protein
MQKFNHNQLSSRGDFGEEKIQKKLKMWQLRSKNWFSDNF